MRRKMSFMIIVLLAAGCICLCGLFAWQNGSLPLPFRAHKAYREAGFREEKVAASETSEADAILSMFLDEDRAYLLVKSEADEKEPYRIVDITRGGSAEDARGQQTGEGYEDSGDDGDRQTGEGSTTANESRFAKALSAWQRAQKELHAVTYEVVGRQDDSLYLAGQKNAVYVNKLIRLSADRASYEELSITGTMPHASVTGIEMSPKGAVFITTEYNDWKSRYRLSLQDDLDLQVNISKDMDYDMVARDYNVYVNASFVPGVSVYYYRLDDDPVVIKGNIFGDATTDGLASKYITNADAPACLDERDGIYIAETGGILYHAKNGSIWELIVPAQDMKAFDRERYKVVQIMRASEHAYYLLAEDKKTGGRTVYAYFDD